MDYFNAFWVGGLICALVQILLDKTKLMPGRVMVLLVCTGSILGAIGIYQPLIDFAGAGAAVPLLGFGNTLWKGLKECLEFFDHFAWSRHKHTHDLCIEQIPVCDRILRHQSIFCRIIEHLI